MSEGDRAFDAGAFEEAQEHYREALATGRIGPVGLVHLHRRLGVIATAFGREDAAREHFSLMLALDPEVETPPELNVPQRAALDALREQVSPFGLAVDTPEPLRAGEPLALELRPSLSLGRFAQRLVIRAGDWEAELPVEATVELQAPATVWDGRTVVLTAEAQDEHGGPLLRVERRLTALVPQPSEAPTEAAERGGMTRAGRVLLIVTAIVVAGVGVTLAVLGARGAFEPRYRVTVIDGDVGR